MSLFMSLNTALRGIMAQQTAQSVTANNIANTNTDGYTRQRVELQESYPLSGIVPGAQLGTGVDVADILRIRDEYLDYQIHKQNSTLQYDNTMADTLGNMEIFFNETADNKGLDSQLDAFWQAWQDLSVTPDSTPVRTTVVEAATTLVNTLHELNTQLNNMQDETQTQIDLSITNVNNITEQIARLNDQIVKMIARKEAPNSLLDARDLLMDELSGIGNLTVTQCTDANGNYTGAISVQMGSVTVVDDYGDSVAVDNTDLTSSTLTDGSLAALLHLNGDSGANDTIQYYLDKLDVLAAGIAENINSVHTTGTDSNGDLGEAFFMIADAGASFTAANISVNSAIKNNVSKIAAALNDINIEGNGDIALQLAQLKNTKLDANLGSTGVGTMTINGFYEGMTVELGAKIDVAEARVDNQKIIVDNLTGKRESISGVNIDEETTHLILYQNAYSASAKVVTYVEKMFDSLMSMI